VAAASRRVRNASFRDDHFRFNEGIFTSADETIYIGNAIAARVVDEREEVTSKPEGSELLGGAVAGAAAGAWLSPFSAGASVAVGAVVGAVAAGAAGSKTTPGQITFEMRFKDDRVLVGTVGNSGWADIQEAWRISAYAVKAAARLPPKLLPLPDINFQWLGRFIPWGRR
jgi:hypothetical protein